MNKTQSCCSSCSPRCESPGTDQPARSISHQWTWKDHVGAWKVRWGIGRNTYRVEPGLYRAGSPDATSPVLVTANYKLTFDLIRRQLAGRHVWLLVLDTRGINVWCAAGKGTFGTDELVNRIHTHRLDDVVSHRRIIVPQLGAPGVAAHAVHQATGFKVVYGPVRAVDVPRFLDNNLKADAHMRTVTFTLRERLAVAPVELVQALRYFLPVALAAILISLFFGTHALSGTGWTLLVFLGAVLAGTVLFPILLPFIPGRSFAIQGAFLGVIYAGFITVLFHASPWIAIAGMLLLPAVVAFISVNFTGSTTFTNLSGVQKELLWSIPIIIISAVLGIVAGITGVVLGG